MKNIEAILKEFGVEVTDEQLGKIKSAVNENYKTVADYTKQTEKVDSLTKSLEETQEALKKFDGVDAEALKQQIADLEKAIEDNKADYESKIANRDFEDLVNSEIAAVKGLNPTAIKALLKMDELKGSKNQKEDVNKAIKALTEAEDSKMLFGSEEPKPAGKGDPIGTVKKGNEPTTLTLSSALAEHYKE